MSSPKYSEPTAAVVCRNVSKYFALYGRQTRTLRDLFIRTLLRRKTPKATPHFAIRDFNLEIQRGEAIAFLGSNGSGKTTLLRLIAGIYAPTEGDIQAYGRLAPVIELGAGFHHELTGRENVMLYGALLGIGRREMRERFDSILEFSGVGEFRDTPVKYYSTGMKARLAFAVTIHTDPDTLLLDEVLAVGDESFRGKCFDKLREFRERGCTLIAVTHDMSAARVLCDRAAWIDSGSLRMVGGVDEVAEAYVSNAHGNEGP